METKTYKFKLVTGTPIGRVILFLLLVSITSSFYCQGNSINIIALSDSVNSPRADLSSIAWIEGHWRGTAFGGITEEIWTPPLAGSMMCTFKLVVNGKVKFYELVTISEEAGTLILRLKHFHPTLKGWEEKDKTIDFRLVKLTENKIYFDEFTFERIGSNEMNIYVVIESNGKRQEVKFSYTTM